MIELRSREMTCTSDDGDAAVTVLRKLGSNFPAEVQWSTQDGDALAGSHYQSKTGERRGKLDGRVIQLLVSNDLKLAGSLKNEPWVGISQELFTPCCLK